MSPAAAELKYYVDADLLGVAKVLVTVRSDVTYPGDPGGLCPNKRERPPCVITPATPDHLWIPIAAAAGWIVITKDSGIGRSPRLRALVIEHGARLVTVASRAKKMNTWEHLEILISVWRNIDELAPLPGPWIYRAHRGGLKKVA